MEYDPELIHQLVETNPKVFIEGVRLALWADKAEEMNRELVYMDEELMVFRKKKNVIS